MAGSDPVIVAGARAPADKAVIDVRLIEHFGSVQGVSISLKYFRRQCEGFINWKKDELKAFDSLIEKLRERTPEQVRSSTKMCHAHRGKPAHKRFTRPDDISEDLGFYGLWVTDKARVHGFFTDPIFFLVWLDREHECFPGD